MNSKDKDLQTKRLNSDLQQLTLASVAVLCFAAITAITPFGVGEHSLWFPVVMVATFVFQIGWTMRRAISSLNKRVSELEGNRADAEPRLRAEEK